MPNKNGGFTQRYYIDFSGHTFLLDEGCEGLQCRGDNNQWELVTSDLAVKVLSEEIRRCYKDGYEKGYAEGIRNSEAALEEALVMAAEAADEAALDAAGY